MGLFDLFDLVGYVFIKCVLVVFDMDRKVAKKLLGELGRRGRLVTPNNELFLDILVSAKVPESSRFYEEVSGDRQTVRGIGRCHCLSLSKILRNKNAKYYQLSQWGRAYEAVASAFGICSSDALGRDLQADENLIRMMTECEDPFSLLGKLETYDFEKSKGKLLIRIYPVLGIPGVEDMNSIYDWERANTVYEEVKVVGFFPKQKRISSQEYLSC